jgi:hypothetical protein
MRFFTKEFQNQVGSNLPAILVFMTNTSWIFLVSAGVILVIMFLRLGVYFRSRKAL